MVQELGEQQGKGGGEVWRAVVQDLGVLLGVQRHYLEVRSRHFILFTLCSSYFSHADKEVHLSSNSPSTKI